MRVARMAISQEFALQNPEEYSLANYLEFVYCRSFIPSRGREAL
jgi:hypothetical protein